MKNKGGRPSKQVKRKLKLSAHCTGLEKNIIISKAKACNMPVSKYLRIMAIDGEITIKSYPREILNLTSQINHIAANCYMIARKSNFNKALSDNEMEILKALPNELQKLSLSIKSSIK